MKVKEKLSFKNTLTLFLTFVSIVIVYFLLSTIEYLITEKYRINTTSLFQFKKIILYSKDLFFIISSAFLIFFFPKFLIKQKENRLVKQKNFDLEEKDQDLKLLTREELIYFFNYLEDLVFVLDIVDYKVVDINYKVTANMGYLAKELVGNDFLSLVKETDVQLFKKLITKKQTSCTFKLKTKAGLMLNYELTSFEGRWKEKEVIFLKFKEFSNLIDEQKELIRFKAAVEQNPNLILVTDTNGHIEYVNPTFTKVTGYLFSDVITLNPRFMKTEKQPVEFYNNMWKTISAGKIWEGELLNRKANGQTYWQCLSISPIKNNNGEIINYLGIAQDITERKISEFRMKRMNDDLKLAESETRAAHEELKTSSEALEQSYFDLKIAKEKAEESDRLKSAFLANMSHEIRTPLNGIIGFSDLLTAENISKEKRLMYKSVITASGSQLLKMVTDIIDISKLESGQVEIFNSPFNLNELLDEIDENFKKQDNLQENKDLQIISYKELPNNYVNIITDKNKLKQVFINLISNAIKFSHKGEINFGYLVRGDLIECYVKDQGIGIAKENQDIIFKQFRQVEGSLNRQFGGAGIGLSISKGYIELLGGEMWLDSEEDKGSIFYFSIPYNIMF